MNKQFSLSYLTIPGIEPVEQIKIARQAGYDYVSLRTIPMGLPGEPQVCLEKDAALFETIRRTLKDYEMKLYDIELVRIREDLSCDFRAAFEKGAELGATQVLSSVWTKDHAFAVERYGSICEQAAEFGLTVNLEFPIVSGLILMKDALAVQEKVGAANLKVMVDMIYAYLDKVTPQAVLEAGADRFGVVHLCDWPRDTSGHEMVHFVREGRAYCGEGCVDLEGLLKALPVSPYPIELPNAEQIAKLGAAGHAARCLETAKSYFAAHGLL